MIRSMRLLASAAPLFLIAGCGDGSTQPSQVMGTYAAIQANGSSLPTSILTLPSGDGIRLIQGSLSVRAPDTLLLALRTQYVDPSGAAGAPGSDTTWALYQRSGSTLELSALASRPLEIESPATLASAGSIQLTVLRRLPASAGFGTYPVALRLRR